VAALANAHREAAGPAATTPAGPIELGSVAIVHDYLNQPGGAERVVLAMAGMWPNAPIYTSLWRVDSTFPGFGGAEIRTSPLDLVPIDRAFRNLFPLYPVAFRAFGTLDQDVVISSSSGWAHSVRTAPHTFHVVYCYTPARWLYGAEYLGGDPRRKALELVAGAVRRWDGRAARRADLYIAISNEVRERIRLHYGVDAPVVYPPVDTERFHPTPRGERLLVVSRLLPYKRVDAIIDAATRAGIGLDVVGTGPALDDLCRRAGKTVTFHGSLSDDHIVDLMEGCRALCLPGKEDFGITPIEANAAGKPVVAFAAGGALETVQEGVTGAFFSRYNTTSVLDAIDRADRIQTEPAQIAASTRRFSRHAFELGLRRAVEDGVSAHQRNRRRD
jgi:glycosyltransferase involved in cell wall biosynthesis